MPERARVGMLDDTMPTRRGAVLAVLALLGVSAAPAVALDDTPPVPLPPEPPAIELPGLTMASLTFDLDGDGVRELVRVVRDTTPSPGLVVEAWTVSRLADGPRPPRRSPPLRRDASVDEQLSGLPRPGRDGTLTVGVGDPVRLVVMRVEGRERIVLAVQGSGGDEALRPCCLTLWEVVPDEEALGLRRVGGIQQEAVAVVPADLDGDGTDELVAVEAVGEAGQTIRIYHPGPGAPRTDGLTLDVTGLLAESITVGETDGLPGDDVLMIADVAASTQPSSALVRLSVGAAGPRAEMTPLSGLSIPAVLPDRTMVLSELQSRSTAFAAWPAGGEVKVTRRLDGVAGIPVAVLEAEGEARLITASQIPRRDEIRSLAWPIDAARGTVEELPLEPPTAGILGQLAVPSRYAGPVPMGDRQPTSRAIVEGTLLTLDGGRVMVRPVRELPGMQLAGTMGEDDAILVVEPRAVGVIPSRLFDAGMPPADGTLLVDAATLLRADGTGGELLPGLRGAVRDPAETHRVITAERAFELLIHAPRGSRVAVGIEAIGPGSAEPAWEPLDGGTTAVRVALDGGDTTAVTALVRTPTGALYATRLDVERRTANPSLVLDAPVTAWSDLVPITGTTDIGVTVSINGAPVPVDADGRFATAVSAGITPMQVRVEAVDPLGHRTVSALSVVGWFDYRGLPWIWIVVALTLVVGATLWLRTPGPRRWSRHGPDDDAVLEEIE